MSLKRRRRAMQVEPIDEHALLAGRAAFADLLVVTVDAGGGIGLARELAGGRRLHFAARKRGRTSPLLDTFEGPDADAMDRKWGRNVVGRIPDYARAPHGELRALILFSKAH